MFLKISKVLFLIIFILLNVKAFSQQKMNDYSKQWKKVEELEKKGLTKSALTEVLSIYNLAIKENNDAQQIKSCMYQIKYRNMVEEDSHENNIFFVDTLIAKAKAPAKNILQSMQAEMFWQYVQNNRWKFNDRTKLAEEKSKDITTWSLDKLHNTIGKLYKASLQNDALLKQNNLTNLDAIIIKGTANTKTLRPTLYDFLAHRALSYFTTGESDLTKPAYQFTLKDEAYFLPAADFAKQKFTTKDTASLYYKAILLFQDVLAFHVNDANADALIDADLQRLQFVYNYGVMQGKQKLFENALKNIEEKNTSNPIVARAMFARAQLYYNNGQNYNPLSNHDNQYEIKRAKDLLDATIAKYTKSEGAINAQNLINTIIYPTLNLTSEKVNVINQPFRTLVQYKNIKTVYLRLIKMNREEFKKFDYSDYKKYWKNLTALPKLKEWSVNLPDLQDYQQHSTEIKIDALGSGTYIILASKESNFDLDKNILAQQFTYVSNISYIHNQKNEYYVLNRDNGQPIANAQVQVWENIYNNNKNRYEETKSETYKSDKNGMFVIKKEKEYRNFSLQIKTIDDELFMDDSHYASSYNSYDSDVDDENTKTFLFTDRSIYRPNQTVFFKGIVIKKDKDANKSKVVSNFKSTIILTDANGQKVSDLKLTTNDYGSYQGSFKLPEGLLTGSFSIQDSTTASQIEFSVEEYKRPKFFVEVAKPKGTYKVNDSIKVIGTAKGYAGNLIDGATVKYRVVRKTKYPIWWGWYKWGGYNRNEEVEITNGTAKTDEKGEFKINFLALPDESADKKNQPTFNYEVTADVTDINGETRSGETSVAVSYQLLKLDIVADDKINVDSLKNLVVKSTNTNDTEEKATATIIIQKLKNPNKIFRARYWQQPDQFVMSKEEYYGYFPYDVYKNEDNKMAWENDGAAIILNDSTNQKLNQQNINTINSTFKSSSPVGGDRGGFWCKITALTKDKNGEEVKAEKYVELTMENGRLTTNNNQPITLTKNKNTFEPTEKIEYSFATGFDKIWLIHTLNKMNVGGVTNYYNVVKNTATPFSIIANETDRGGIGLNYVFVQHNRVYKGSESFNIPWSNKDLQITYNTFRDKLLPGANEKWSVKISGNKGQKLAAEVLASMYDASLDQFKPHSWQPINIWGSVNNYINWQHNGFTQINSTEYNGIVNSYLNVEQRNYDRLGIKSKYGEEALWWLNPLDYAYDEYPNRKTRYAMKSIAPQAAMNEVVVTAVGAKGKKNVDFGGDVVSDSIAIPSFDPFDKDSKDSDKKSQQSDEKIQIRKNFNETAFFFPQLKTDAEGNVEFSFTMPEALTQWKLQTFAHTKDARNGYVEKTLVTQKPLMVQPNAPRFLREGDKMEFSAKVVNLTDKEITGTATLQFTNATTNTAVDGWFKNVFPNQYFTVAAGQSVAVKFPMEVPFNFNSAVTYTIIAKADGASDGEEMALPVLTNRMLVTETMPLNLKANEKNKTFKFEKLLKASPVGGGLEGASTLTHHALTVEYSSNPAWYAVQALPYLMEYPYECAEQTFNRYYANTLASFVTNSNPKIKAVFEKWKTIDTAALKSNLEKNEELKSALLQETPWVLEAQNEATQKKNIALLFDLVKLSAEQEKAFTKLKEMQLESGGFTWFKGGREDRYMTQYIITGIGHLRKLKALSGSNYENVKSIVDKALPYVDRELKREYDDLKKYKVKLSNNNLSYTAIQYLYMRSFFNENKIASASQTAVDYYLGQAKKYWLSQTKYMQAMIALGLYRNNDAATPKAIIQSLKENSITKEEMGMYWKDWANGGGYYWHQAPIESQAMMIEAFTDIDKNENTIDELKTWLLKQKQTQNWKTTKATAEACYALLLNGSNWLAQEKEVTINLGNTTTISSSQAAEAGTGYFKKRIEGEKVKPEMGNITVSLKSSMVPSSGGSGSWGSVYWQYFEDLDKITSAETPLKLKKQLFLIKNTEKGEVLTPLSFGEGLGGEALKVGDKVKVRIELKVDRDMEYVHMKDMRAGCMEPVNVLSEYKWQGGLGYYESTKDASTNFFFSWLNKGTYIFEYPLFVTHTGNFSNGITSIQCMYAPEFTSHSEGVRVTVE